MLNITIVFVIYKINYQMKLLIFSFKIKQMKLPKKRKKRECKFRVIKFYVKFNDIIKCTLREHTSQNRLK